MLLNDFEKMEQGSKEGKERDCLLSNMTGKRVVRRRMPCCYIMDV